MAFNREKIEALKKSSQDTCDELREEISEAENLFNQARSRKK